MSTEPGSTPPPAAAATVEDLFAKATPIRSADDLAHDGIFEDDEVEEFLTDLYAMRRSHIA